MLLAVLSFTLMISAVKVARAELSSVEIIFFRALIALPIAVLLCLRTGFKLKNRKAFASRAGFGFVAMVGYYTATKGLTVADLSILTKLQPIIVAIAAPLLINTDERGGKRVWLALLIGLSGCAILLGPELSVGSVYGGIALFAVFGSAIAHMSVRVLGKTEPPSVVVFWFQVALIVVSFFCVIAYTGKVPQLPSRAMMGPVLMCGLCATAGQLLMTWAYTKDTAPVVAAAAYSGPVWAVLIDLIYFGVHPSWGALIGGALVVGAGLALVLRR